MTQYADEVKSWALQRALELGGHQGLNQYKSSAVKRFVIKDGKVEQRGSNWFGEGRLIETERS